MRILIRRAGTGIASDDILHEAKRLSQKEVPTVISMVSDLSAASGGVLYRCYDRRSGHRVPEHPHGIDLEWFFGRVNLKGLV